MTFLSTAKSKTFPEIRSRLCRKFDLALGASLSLQIYVCFLKHPEQFEHAGEGLPAGGAVSAYPPLEPSVRSRFDVEEKANRLPRCW
jgi:hypothetical protein